jgi:hypothetical protein
MIFGGSQRRSVFSFILSTAVLVLFIQAMGQSIPAEGNPEGKKKQKKKADSANTEQDLIRWRFLLDQLGEQARALSEEKIRPQLMAEVASAYWGFDKQRSEEMFLAALEVAVNLKSNRDSSQAVRRVLALAARSNASVGKRIAARFMELRAEDTRSTTASIEAAFDLLKFDPQVAAQLAEASAPAGLSSDAAGVFILQLAQQNPQAAEKVYRAYLNKAAISQSLPLGQLLWLGGYPFGYGEAYGFAGNNPAAFSGLGGRQIPGLAPNPSLANAFLDLAIQTVRRTIQVAASEPPQKREMLNGLAVFATAYLSPEVARYRPDMLSAWQLLSRQAASSAPMGLQQELSGRLQSILTTRSVAQKRAQSLEHYHNEGVQSALERSEKLPEGCERDRAYAQAAISLSNSKDNARALSLAEKIKDVSLRESIKQFLYYEMSGEAIEKDLLYDAQKYARQVDAREQRTLLYVKMGGAALRQKDQVLANQLMAEMRQMTNGISDRSAQAAVLLASAAIYAQYDMLIANETVKEAIKAINQSGTRNVDSFSVLRKVNLACSGESQEQWFGSQDQAEQFSLLETLSSLAKNDVDGYFLMAQGIEDPATRIRAQLVIVRAAIKN